MRVSGNRGLSRPHEDVGPPPGGFGAAEPPEAGIVRLRSPKERLHIGVIVSGLVVLAGVVAAVAYVRSLAYAELRLAQYGQGRQDLIELEPLITESYRKRGELCPSAADASDPGWTCLGFVPKSDRTTRLRYERLDADRVLLTAGGNGFERHGVRVRWALRGYIDAAEKTVAFEDIVEEREP